MVGIAQLVRAPVCGTGGRGFNSHFPPILNNAPVAQLDRAVDFESEGRRFESCRARMNFVLHGSLAQLVEQLTLNQRATGSIPVRPKYQREWRNWQTR